MGSVTFSLGRKLAEYFRNSDSLLGVRVTATEGRDAIEITGKKKKKKRMGILHYVVCFGIEVSFTGNALSSFHLFWINSGGGKTEDPLSLYALPILVTLTPHLQ